MSNSLRGAGNTQEEDRKFVPKIRLPVGCTSAHPTTPRHTAENTHTHTRSTKLQNSQAQGQHSTNPPNRSSVNTLKSRIPSQCQRTEPVLLEKVGQSTSSPASYIQCSSSASPAFTYSPLLNEQHSRRRSKLHPGEPTIPNRTPQTAAL